ncbi:MAG: hypothetical protein AMJ90_04915 [candidate division Zixibacteria bacterium SM23_73_2]|nr:MAG: hypothetical protein AMJ90_04915 [candidate division Zixibacteria bacterium SM23_73_2]
MKKSIIFSFLLIVVFTYNLSFAVTGDIVTSFPSPGTCPVGLTFDGKFLWIADYKTDTLYQIDPENGGVVNSLPSPGFRPSGLTWDGKYLWNVDLEENLIYQVDPETGIAVKTIFCPSSSPMGLCWDGKYLWVSDSRADKLYQLSTEDGTTIIELPSPSSTPQGLCWDGKYLWVADRIEDKIFMITPDKGEVILYFESPESYARGLAWDGKYLWNVDYQSDRIYKIKIEDEDPFKRKDQKCQSLEFTNEFRNYGPGEVKDVNIYIAVPENLPNQELLAPVVFEPEPDDIISDKWGQKVALFRFQDLKPTEFRRASMKAMANIYQTDYFIFPEKVGSIADIPGEIKKKYLVDDTKFCIDDPFIKNSAEKVVGDEQNPYWIARKLYNFVLANMHYELAGGWNIAPAVLKRGSGSCSEYSFVYIALCRASGIPARYAGSVAIRGDDASQDDVFHRWCEIYLPNYGWIPVDPSGGDYDTPWHQARAFGHLANRYLITTVGGGGSEYLEWGYNSNEKWTSQGKCKVYTEHIGEWSPLEQGSKAKE